MRLKTRLLVSVPSRGSGLESVLISGGRTSAVGVFQSPRGEAVLKDTQITNVNEITHVMVSVPSRGSGLERLLIPSVFPPGVLVSVPSRGSGLESSRYLLCGILGLVAGFSPLAGTRS